MAVSILFIKKYGTHLSYSSSPFPLSLLSLVLPLSLGMRTYGCAGTTADGAVGGGEAGEASGGEAALTNEATQAIS